MKDLAPIDCELSTQSVTLRSAMSSCTDVCITTRVSNYDSRRSQPCSIGKPPVPTSNKEPQTVLCCSKSSLGKTVIRNGSRKIIGFCAALIVSEAISKVRLCRKQGKQDVFKNLKTFGEI